jgi:DNA modification methylase
MGSTNNYTLSIEVLSVERLVANKRNSRTHDKRQIRQIAASIKNFGFTNPILIDRDNVIVAGHGRVAAARLLGIPEVPTIRLENLTPDEIRAYVIADNRLAERAGWDNSLLSIELQHLLTLENGLDVTITGFEMPEIDLLLTPPVKLDAEDKFEMTDVSQAITRAGDVWQLGRHRIVCGNSLDDQSFSTLLDRKRASVVFTDPPYNLPIEGHVSGNGSVHHREFQMASGEMDEFTFTTFLTSSFRLLTRFSVAGSVHFVCMDWRHIGELVSAGKQVYDAVLNLCVWAKNTGGMGSLYRSRHELIFVFRNGQAQHLNNVQLGRYGRNRTNVWQYAGINTLSKTSDEGNLLELHPTVKPVALIADALLDCSARGDIVLDAFLGSGSTLMAAERTGRACCGIELDAAYVDTAVKRWQRYTGEHAMHVAERKTFDALTVERHRDNGND